jgi:hypothetical protein
MKTIEKRRGRPLKGSADKKSDAILLRLEPREKEGFGAAAAIAGVPLAVWMRERLRRIARQELEEAKQPIPFLQ